MRHSFLQSKRWSTLTARQSNWNDFRPRYPKLRANQPIRTLRPRPAVPATSAEPSSTSASQSSEEAGKSHAALHDFCMTIPYGIAIGITGLFGCVVGYGNLAVFAAIAGSAVCLSSFFSLRAWRAGQSHARYTVASAGTLA